jgi:peroxiredoxin
MVALQTPQVNLGWHAEAFNLIGIDDKQYSLHDLQGEKGLVIAFICNHCPFVRAIIDKVILDANELKNLGVNFVAINSNDPVSYPEDSFGNMKIFATKHEFTFPYLFDETQQVARNYGAVCTPDFFGFGADLTLQYRGRFDASGMTNTNTSNHELLNAMKQVALHGRFDGEQKPSIGCSIKWHEQEIA